MPDNADHYRRLAKECLDAANAGVSEKTRAALIEMAQTHLRRADELEVIPPPPSATKAPQPTMQQQQQPQSKTDTDKE